MPRLVRLVLALALTAPLASGQPEEAPDPMPDPLLEEDADIETQPGLMADQPPASLANTLAPPSATRVSLSLSGEYWGETDLQDRPGSVSIARATAEVGVSTALSRNVRLSISLSHVASNYDFSGEESIFGGPLPRDVHSTNLTANAIILLDENWSISIGGLLRAALEPGADFGDSLSGGSLTTVGYRFDENLSLRFGVFVARRLEGDARLIPIAGIDWRITEKLTLRSEGAGLELAYQFDPELRGSVLGRWESRQYRLNPDRSVLANNILDDDRLVVGAALGWSPAPGLELRVEGGAAVFQRYEFREPGGFKFLVIESDPAPYLSLAIEYVF